MTAAPRLILASASPARRQLLAAAGVATEVQVSGVDEDVAARGVTEPIEVAGLLATAKARAVAATAASGDLPSLVLGCDSVLEMPGVPELAGRALGKPADAEQAVQRWRLMRGQTGTLHTGHCLIEVGGPVGAAREQTEVGSTDVRFAEPTDAEIAAYVATGEPLRVAGGFTLDGLGGAFVRGVDGDPANVVGLSLPLLREMLTRIGVAWPSLWSSQPR